VAELFDYASLIAVAEGLTRKFGRSITFVGFDTVPAAPSEPWKGPTAPRTTSTTLTCDGVFVEPESLARLGIQFQSEDLMNRAQKVIICTPGIGADMKLYDEVIDSTDTLPWKILMSEVLQPGPTLCCAFLWVRR
jgi:hypothetical protein